MFATPHSHCDDRRRADIPAVLHVQELFPDAGTSPSRRFARTTSTQVTFHRVPHESISHRPPLRADRCTDELRRLQVRRHSPWRTRISAQKKILPRVRVPGDSVIPVTSPVSMRLLIMDYIAAWLSSRSREYGIPSFQEQESRTVLSNGAHARDTLLGLLADRLVGRT